jgi:hypothetical protein
MVESAGHRLYRDGVFLRALDGLASQQFTDSGLSHSSTHCHAMSAIDGTGQEGVQSTAACATTDLFSLQLVDPTPLLSACSIALDASGKVHVCYVGLDGLRYATSR